MKARTFLVSISFVIIIVGCNSDKKEQLGFIETIENGLLPGIILESDTASAVNILDRMDQLNIPGVSIAFLNKGKIEWAKGYGIGDTVRNRAINDKTLFQAASISKPVAALAALHLVEQGKLGLDDNVNDYLEDWQVEENKFIAEEKVTLRRILSHSAGLTVHGFRGYSKTEDVPTIIEVLNGEKPANSGKIYSDTVPGSIYRYSGGGYTVMQKMLSDITGKDFPALLDEVVLSKIQMGSSTYKQPLPEEKDENAAWGHRSNGNLVDGNWHTYPEMAAAGLWTNPTDLLKYAREICKSWEGKSNILLSKEMVREMLTPQMDSHGLGPAVRGEGEYINFSHGGANEGFRCGLFIYTKTGQGVAVMTNGDNGGQLVSEIYRSFSNALGWPNYKPQVKSTISMGRDQLSTFNGKYLLNLNGQDLIIKLTADKDHLQGYQIWDDFKFKLYPEADYKFFGLHDGIPFEFKKNELGEISELVITQSSVTYILKKL